MYLFAKSKNHEEHVTVENETQSRNEDKRHAKGPRDHSSSPRLVVCSPLKMVSEWNSANTSLLKCRTPVSRTCFAAS